MANDFTPTLKLEHADARGEIYSITLPGDQELMLLHSVAGSLRGGHAHTVDEVVVVLTGKMNYTKRVDESELEYAHEWDFTMKAGDVEKHHRGEYHLAAFSEDSWLIEYKLNTSKGHWRNIDHPAWREKVKSNSAG